MATNILIGKLEHGGISTAIEVAEGKNFRRIEVVRRRLMFGEYKEVGKVHIYVDEVDTFIEVLENAQTVMRRIGEVGFDTAWLEWGMGGVR